jgi:hypothetical protein
MRCWISFALPDGTGRPPLPAKSSGEDEDFGRGAYGARHSIPLQRHMTSPRQYIGPDGRALLPGNSARKAISEEFARAAMLPGESRSEKPVFAERMPRSSNRNPALIRGKRTKKSTTSGNA